jgi:hypothetical protein
MRESESRLLEVCCNVTAPYIYIDYRLVASLASMV